VSADGTNTGSPILPGSPLARALDDYTVPALSAGFADRVLAAAENRSAALPELRRAGAGGSGRGWRLGRRIAIASLGFGALASAAAATGILERFDIPVPSPQKVWASITGKEASPTAVPVASKPLEPANATQAPVVIEGPIDTPEELSEAFRRIDEVRQGRIEERRQLTDQRIDRAIERRRAAGLLAPTTEEEVRLRQRIDEAQTLRQQRAEERIKARRTELERKVESGEALTREDIVGMRREDSPDAERRERYRQLRQMTPQQRREALKRLPPEQRRAIIEEFRVRRGAAASATPETSTEIPAPEADPAAQLMQPQS
jgi:hypothetical protein